MAPTSKKSQDKYERQKELARERQRRRKARLTEEQKEAKRKYDRERMAKLRSEKKIKSIKDMTPRDQRKMRKYWRERNKVRTNKKRALAEALADTPPQSPNPDEPAQRRRGRRKVRKEKAKVYRKVKKQEKQIRDLKKRLERYKKRLVRQKQQSQNPASPSPRKQVHDVIGREKVSPAVKRQLFLGFVLKKQLQSQRRLLVGTKKQNQLMQKHIGNKVLKKYKVQGQFRDILPYRANKMLNNDGSLEYSRKTKKSILKELSGQITKFYEDDRVSKMCPGKRDFIRKGSTKKQRRVLLQPLQELHSMFKRETKCKISFTTFTRARPFWVTLPKKSDRETCACVKHANMELLVSALKQTKVIIEKNPSEVVKAVVCSTENENCLMGRCNVCKNKKIHFFYEDDFKVKYLKWKNVSEEKTIKNKKKVVKRTMKVKVVRKVSKLKTDFAKELEDYKKHVYFSKHQIDAIKDKTENLAKDELVFRIDFSENYVTKMANEVQSFHFGASKRQLSLNTGVRYANDGENIKLLCFATVSDNIDHQAHAIWAHMHPILQKSAIEFPDTKTIHFVSDSPSNQYRNRFNIHLFTTIVPTLFKKIKNMTWNYTEAGHGKGPMDGVGGTLKRLADRKVSYGSDITCAKDFVDALEDCNICLLEVPSTDIVKRKVELNQLQIAPISGIMKVHQFTFSNGTMCDARELSCFDCPPSESCTHYHLRGVVPGVTKLSSCVTKSSSGVTKSSATGKKKHSPRNLSSSNDIEHQPSTEPDVMDPIKKKSKLSVDAVYTSSDDDEGEVEQVEHSMPLQDFIDAVKHHQDVSWENLQSGDYILVQYTTDKKKTNFQNFVGICQSSMCNNEVDVMFMKPCKKDNNLYYVDDNDRASVLKGQIKALLPQPKIILKGNRVFYKFLKL